MIKRSFFSLRPPKLKYPVGKGGILKDIVEIDLPDVITLLCERADGEEADLDIHDLKEVQTGQKINLSENGQSYCISTATGSITDICPFTGYMVKNYTSISVQTSPEDQWDDAFRAVSNTVSSENALMFLRSLPGEPDLTALLDPEKPLDTIIINGMDNDLLVTTNRAIVQLEPEDLAEGIRILKQITGVQKIILTIPLGAGFQAGGLGAEVRAIEPIFPNALPQVIMKEGMGRVVPAGRSCRDMGVGFINAEAVAALGRAFQSKKIPISKTLTVIHKDYSTSHIRARVGTPIKNILAALQIEINHGDRMVLGGPMMGVFAYSEDQPISWDTDAIMIQDKEQIIPCEDTPCINCGECIRICPAKIPVNMLVRLLENGRYEEGVEDYDLLSCIECGLCAYVCTARIPIFHYIMLGKYEYEKIKRAEEINA